MATQSTALLGLALPVTGELDGVWGDTVNDQITSLIDSAIAGATTLTVDADVTLSTTTLAANQARQAIILWTASGTVTRNITAPASSKTYIVINSTSGTQSIVIRGAGPTTGVTIPAGGKAVIAWNGSDFVKIVSNPAVLTTDVTGTLPVANGGTGQTSYTNGQLLIGNTTGNTLTKATLTAGSNVTITNGPGSVIIDAAGGGGTTASGSVVLTSASVTAQAITTTTYGQTVTFPDATTVSKGGILYNISNLGAYPLKIVNNAGSTLGFVYPNCPVTVGLADNSTAAGTWSLVGAEPYAVVAQNVSASLKPFTNEGFHRVVVIDADRTLFLLVGTTISGIIYNSSTLLFGSVTLIRGTNPNQVVGILSATNQVLVSSSNGTAMEAVVLTLSNTTITVGTAATATLSAASTTCLTAENLVAVGSSFVVTTAFNSLTDIQMRAMTISGTTVTIGTATTLNGTNTASASANVYVHAVSSSVVLVLTNSTSTFFATPYAISGTAITLGTGATFSSNAASEYKVRPISSGARLAVVISATAGTTVGMIISVTSATATISTVTLATGGGTSGSGVIVSGSKLIYVGSDDVAINILTDTAGTASAGTEISALVSSLFVITAISANATTNLATFFGSFNTNGTVFKAAINFTGSSPILSDFDVQSTGGTDSFAQTLAADYKELFITEIFSGATSYVWNLFTSLSGSRAVAVGENCFYSFAPKLVPINSSTDIWNSIAPNKVVCYDTTYGQSAVFGALQIVESVS